MKHTLISIVAVLALTSCASVKENLGGLVGGASAVAAAPVAQAAIFECIADDVEAQESLRPVNIFFTKGYEVIKKKGADIPILTLVAESPDYFDQVEGQWAKLWEVLDGRDCGPVVAQFKSNGEAAWAGIQKAISTSDNLKTACSYWSAIAPVASMFSPIPLPARIPACPRGVNHA